MTLAARPRWLRLSLVCDVDVSGVVLDGAEIDDDLASAFSRGPYGSRQRAMPDAAPCDPVALA